MKKSNKGSRSITSIILVVFAAVLIVSIAIVFATVSQQNTAFTDGIISDQINRAFENLKADIKKLNEDAEKYALALSANANLISCVAAGDPVALKALVENYNQSAGLDYITVVDAQGDVLFELNAQDSKGESLAQDEYVKKALAGTQTSRVKYDDETNITCESAVPISYQGATVGAVITGYSYGRTDMLDELKTVHGVEFTIFANDVRWATTIMDNGERVVGTKLDSKITSVVIGQKQDYFGNADILGNPYKTAYSPILDSSGNAVGVMFAGLPMREINTAQRNVLLTVLIVSVALIAVSIFAVYMFLNKAIKKPLIMLTQGAEDLAAGNTRVIEATVKGKTEISKLARAFIRVLHTVKAMTDDVGMLAKAAVEGQLSVRADSSKHQGDFKNIIDGINNTLDAVITPVNEAAGVLAELSKGNLDVVVEGDYSGDHALIKDALNTTIKAIKGYINEISALLAEIAQGNLTGSIQSEYKGKFTELKASINTIVDTLNVFLGKVAMSANEISSGTRQVAQGSQAISQGASEQSGAIEELTKSVSQIASQTNQNADNAGKANELALTAKKDALEGNERMAAMQQAMAEIKESSMNISKIINVIDEIAFQTNILALNAAVEAARAGRYGQGFAVVAEEVRNLAARSANAANETKVLIENAIKKTEAGTEIADETATALSNIVKDVQEAAELVSQIAEASSEQATGIEHINRGVSELSVVVQTNAATSQEEAAACEQLSGQAEMLKDMVAEYKLRQ
jgi:methyl-accepting chemotaxis protein